MATTDSTETPTTVRNLRPLEPSLPGETRSEYLDRMERADAGAAPQLVARIKRNSKYAHQAPKGEWFDVRKINRGYPQVVGNSNNYDRSDLTFGVRLADGSVVELK